MNAALVSRLAAVATALVIAILASSAYLRLTAPPCAPAASCETPAAYAAPRRLARFAHRASAFAISIAALLMTFVAWSEAGDRDSRRLSLLALLLVAFLALLGIATRSGYTTLVTLGNVAGGNALAALYGWLWWRGNGGLRGQQPAGDAVARTVTLAPAIGVVILVALGLGQQWPLAAALALNMFATAVLLAGIWLTARHTRLRN